MVFHRLIHPMASHRSHRAQTAGKIICKIDEAIGLNLRTQFLSIISLMAAVMAAQAGLVRQVQFNTPSKHAAGSAAAAMLFIFQ